MIDTVQGVLIYIFGNNRMLICVCVYSYKEVIKHWLSDLEYRVTSFV
jgi:hypothetical protein